MKKWLKRSAMLVVGLGLVTQLFGPSQSLAASQSSFPAPEQKIVNVAHRGASGHAPEHTMLAYELGLKMKADYIEIDLQMTKDGTLIAMHDTTVNRTTNGKGAVKDLTIEEIKSLDAGSWFNTRNPGKAKEEYVGLEVPTLEEIFQRFGRSTNYYIETKSPALYPGMEETLLELMDAYKLTGVNGRSSNVIIQSFHPDSLLIINEMNPNIPLVQLISTPLLGEAAEAQLNSIKQYAIGVGPNLNRINQDYVERVRNNGLHIHPYTVNTEENMRKALDLGVTGIFTDYPDLFDQVIKDFKRKK
ncbi:glycerophosphodiester phosphodiesterase [Alkalihalobacterium chitinilyticum]|uniref:Glycerophosphodiester phosphodiesterase n=1 Tax=Alkalihalobacterium chitinilyticum TaxID=2980103 RepID=A0ABT5VLZ1_9BACI|nr:glycerophosphodiester phosphodiesterase [Alkalihalobacterium chitinilyticum]MDE5416280.1 glycerophosphodiester phosphodiesterase [Alkalihalobacterium chitinilyticum]